MNIQIIGDDIDVCVIRNSTMQKLIDTIHKQTQEISRLYEKIMAQREEIYKLSKRN